MITNPNRRTLGNIIRTSDTEMSNYLSGYYPQPTTIQRNISPVNPIPGPTDPNVTPVNPTTDPTNPNYIPESNPTVTPTRGGGGSGGGGGQGTGLGFKDLWSQWMEGTMTQMTNPEGLGNLDDYYGAAIQDVGKAYRSGYRNLQEGLTAGGVGGSLYGNFAMQQWMGGQAGMDATLKQQVRLKNAEERIRQKELGYSNVLQVYGINKQLEGQKAIASSNVAAAKASAEPAMMNAFTNAQELYYKYGITP